MQSPFLQFIKHTLMTLSVTHLNSIMCLGLPRLSKVLSRPFYCALRSLSLALPPPWSTCGKSRDSLVYLQFLPFQACFHSVVSVVFLVLPESKTSSRSFLLCCRKPSFVYFLLVLLLVRLYRVITLEKNKHFYKFTVIILNIFRRSYVCIFPPLDAKF